MNDKRPRTASCARTTLRLSLLSSSSSSSLLLVAFFWLVSGPSSLGFIPSARAFSPLSLSSSSSSSSSSFLLRHGDTRIMRQNASLGGGGFQQRLHAVSPKTTRAEKDVWERMASTFIKVDNNNNNNLAAAKNYPKQYLEKTKRLYELISVLRVGVPALAWATGAHVTYPWIAMWLANAINDAGVFAVVSQDASQYIQNILTTSGLTFSLIAGQTYYFMYQQQEAIYLALFEEVTMAKSLLEQVSLVCQGRPSLYQQILTCMDQYVKDDLTRFNNVEPAELIAARPADDPLENILYLTSVGEPSIVYQTVRSLRQARAYRLGALQRKLPPIHTVLLWVLAFIVLFTFPLLGAGSQTIGGPGILTVQAWYLSFIVFGITLVMGVIDELQRPGDNGAYNARTVLDVMVGGLVEDLELRLSGDLVSSQEGPSIDADGFGGYRGPNES